MASFKYDPVSPAGKRIIDVLGPLGGAESDWMALAVDVADGYQTAYDNHTKALNDVKAIIKEQNETSYFILSLLSVSLAGGLVGGAMAPWVGTANTKSFWSVLARNASSGSKSSAAQAVVQKGLDATKSNNEEPFETPVIAPFKKYLKLTNGVRKMFGRLREHVYYLAKFADDLKLSMEDGEMLRKTIFDMPIVAKSPADHDSPDPSVVANMAELGMWIAWAHKRDIGYWTKRVNELTDGRYDPYLKDVSYKGEVLQLQPITNRLVYLGATRALSKIDFGPMGLTSPLARNMPQYHGQTFVNIPKLKLLGAIQGGPFYENMHAMLNPTTAINALERLSSLAPSYARK
jgi:hypothetical protein